MNCKHKFINGKCHWCSLSEETHAKRVNDDLLKVCEGVLSYFEGHQILTEEEEGYLEILEQAINKAKHKKGVYND